MDILLFGINQIALDETSHSVLSLASLLRHYLTIQEASQICQQFQGKAWHHDSQVMWSGIPRERAQRWAEDHEMRTLTTAMGPLMDPEDPSCLKSRKSSNGWGKYVKDASAIFAWYIARGEKATVLLPPPPYRFHPSGLTNYQAIEEPILKGILGGSTVPRIEVVHPTVNGAESFRYQLWPVDESQLWIGQFGNQISKEPCWRMVKNVSKEMEITTVQINLSQSPREVAHDHARAGSHVARMTVQERVGNASNARRHPWENLELTL